jgi:hypothetical protein
VLCHAKKGLKGFRVYESLNGLRSFKWFQKFEEFGGFEEVQGSMLRVQCLRRLGFAFDAGGVQMFIYSSVHLFFCSMPAAFGLRV